MKSLTSAIGLTTIFLAAVLLLPASLWAASLKGAPAPEFALNDLNGNRHALADLKGHPVVILYFFDATSRTSQDGLLSLDRWIQKYQEADLRAWGITRSDKASINDFMTQTKLKIPILLDTANVSDTYRARTVLPTVCIIGPKGRVLHFIQGGGKSNEIMLTQLTEVQLQRRQTDLAAEMGEELSNQDPENLKAKALLGHARLQSGNVDQAEETFSGIPAESAEGKRLREEGMSEVYLAKGDFDKAWETAKKLETTAPESAAANVSKAKVLMRKGEKQAAEEELAQGITKESSFAFQQSEAINKQGRLLANRGASEDAIDLYSQAEEIDPFNIEATSNRGLLLEQEGHLDKALTAYREVLKVNEKDIYASVFAKRVEAKLAVENDLEKKKRQDTLIKELSDRFRKQQDQANNTNKDNWTSRPMVLSFINIKESGGLPDRDGLVLVLTDQLAEFLNASGRLKVVDRRMMEAIISELNLGSSELADPQTALKLGKLFAAKIIVTGTIHYLPGETLLSLRLLDTETSMVAKAFTRQLGGDTALEKELGWLNKEILNTVTTVYPLKGYVADVSDDQIMLNIGQNQGVVLGTRFAVIKKGKPVVYKGKILTGAEKNVALLKVVEVAPEYSMAQIISQQAEIKPDDKITETVAEL